MPSLVMAAAALLLAQGYAQDPAQQSHVFRGLLNWRQRIEAIRSEPASSTSKQLYIAFLKRRYGYQISAVNEAYGVDASSFTELESSDFSAAPRARLLHDDIAFAAELLSAEAEEFRKSKGKQAVAAVDPSTPPELRKAVEKRLPCVHFAR